MGVGPIALAPRSPRRGGRHSPAETRKLLSSLPCLNGPLQCLQGSRTKHLPRHHGNTAQGPTTCLSQRRLSQPNLPTSLNEERHYPAKFPGHQRKSLQRRVTKTNSNRHTTFILQGCREGKQEVRQGITKTTSTRPSTISLTEEVISSATLHSRAPSITTQSFIWRHNE